MSDATNIVHRNPIGVVGLITPWNLPLYLLSWKVAPALLMGNTIVAKPSEMTPLTAALMCEVASDIGLPPGVINVVHGYGPEVGQAILEHPSIGAISFTGGTATGRHVAATAAPMFKKLSLELGGKNATIVLDDADLDEAVNGAVRAGFTNGGQVCLCGSRILVHQSIADEFTQRLVEAVDAMVCGPPEDASTHIGALISVEHLEKVESYINLGVEEGGVILTGGTREMTGPVTATTLGPFYDQPSSMVSITRQERQQRKSSDQLSPFTVLIQMNKLLRWPIQRSMGLLVRSGQRTLTVHMRLLSKSKQESSGSTRGCIVI